MHHPLSLLCPSSFDHDISLCLSRILDDAFVAGFDNIVPQGQPQQQPMQYAYNNVRYVSWDEMRAEKFKQLCIKHDITQASAQKIKQIEGWEIVVIPDDSGSMDTNLGTPSGFGVSHTRWMEQRRIIEIIIEFGSCLAKVRRHEQCIKSGSSG